MKHKHITIGILPFFLILLNSCLGVSMNISLNRDGSGIVTLNYQISRALDSLGKLDGNERWNTVPVGKADFERTIERLPEVKLLSFASREDDKNTIIDVKMEFSSPRGLLAFLDASGRSAVFSGDGNSGALILNLADPNILKNPSLLKLIADISDNYTVQMGMTFHDQGYLLLLDNSGNAIAIPDQDIQSRGKTVSFSIPLQEVLSSRKGVNAEFHWQ